MAHKRIYIFSLILITVCMLAACRKSADEITEVKFEQENNWSMNPIAISIDQNNVLKKQLEAELNNPNSKLDNQARMKHLALLVKVCRANSLQKEALEYCYQGDMIARKEADNEADAFFQYNIGQVLFDAEEYQCGSHYDLIDSLISDSKVPRVMKEYGVYNLGIYEFRFQIEQYNEGLSFATKALDSFEQSFKADSTAWTTAEYDSLCGTAYIDIARVQARLGNHAEGKKYYDRFLATQYSKTNDGLFHEVNYLNRDNQNEKALEKFMLLEQRVDTADNYDYISAFLPRLRMLKVNILHDLGRWQECCDAYKSYEEARHYWAKCSNYLKMLEAYERYGVGIEKAKSEDVNRVANVRAYVIVALAVLVGLLIIMCVVLMHMQKVIRRKNKVLAANISHQLDESKLEQTVEQPISEPEQKDYALNANEEDRRNVEQFIQEVTSRKLFCDEKFNRDELLDELNIMHRPFPHLFEAFTGTSVQQFILNLRLEYAADLIRRKIEYTIEGIAQESGFSSRSTFYRNFSQKYGITPTEYREQIIKDAII